MKRLFWGMTAALSLSIFGCSKSYDDSALTNRVGSLESRVAALETLCKQLNTNITSLQTIVQSMEGGDYILSVTPVTENGAIVGYTITFAKSGAITIYHGEKGEKGDPGEKGQDGAKGESGAAPRIGVRYETDGVLYWTLDDDWLLDDNGQKIRVTGEKGDKGDKGDPGDVGENGDNGEDSASGAAGITPQLKIENDYWYVSYDNGITWKQLGRATGDKGDKGDKGEPGARGADGDSMFESVTQDDDYVYLKLTNGETLSIPKYRSLAIEFVDTDDIVVRPAQTYRIAYRITGADAQTVVKVLAQDGYRAAVEASGSSEGTIVVTTPSTVLPSEVLVFVSNGTGQTIMRSINFVAEVIVITDKTYYIGKEAQTVEIEVLTNLDYTVSIADEAQSWIAQVPQSRAILRTDRLQFAVEANVTAEKRTALIELKSDGKTLESVLIIQYASTLQSTEVPEAGSLEERLAREGVDTNTLEELRVKGHLNIFDYEFIKTLPKLKTLDLTELDDTELPTGCLEASKIATVLLPRHLRRINNRAFYGAALTALELPETVEWIGNYAFYQCKEIKGNLVIPDATTNIGVACFRECTFDGTLDLGKGVQTINSSAFNGCANFKGDLIIPESTKTLGMYTFAYSGFTGNLVIGNSLTAIPGFCFESCNFAGTLKLGEALTEIGTFAFNESNFKGNLIIPDKVVTIGDFAFSKARFVSGYLVIGESVQEIGQSCFPSRTYTIFSRYYCKALIPPTCGENAIETTYLTSGSTMLLVPIGCLTKYRTTEPWSNMDVIQEIDFN